MQKEKSLAQAEPKVEYKARVSPVPEHFAGREDDRLMWSTIEQYGSEKFIDGKPSGEFYLDQKSFDAIAREVVKTHVKPPSVDAYVKERAESAW